MKSYNTDLNHLTQVKEKAQEVWVYINCISRILFIKEMLIDEVIFISWLLSFKIIEIFFWRFLGSIFSKS